MTGPDRKLIAAVEEYFADLRRVRASGGGTGERSYYPALANLLCAVGDTLKPKVFCVLEGADQGAGHPDYALYTAKQVQKGRPREGQVPERGVVEVKGVGDDAWLTANSDQVSRYWGRYRLVLVTNLRDFVLVGADASGDPAKLETFRLAENADDFWRRLEKPRAFARDVGAGLGEYLCRALSHRAALVEPKDGLAARFIRARRPSACRGGRGRATARDGAVSTGRSARHALRGRARGTLLPFDADPNVVLRNLLRVGAVVTPGEEQRRPIVSGRLQPGAVQVARVGLAPAGTGAASLVWAAVRPRPIETSRAVEVLDWTAAALDRVDRAEFFSRFNEGEAVPYFYEPFLEAFDPALRKQLGVWYTPPEVVRYMVARVDRALKDDLGIPDGLAAENVYVLDPCCGTGAYLAEVLRRIAANLEEQGLGALAGVAVRKAATERVFGFEIMPAPFVVAHLQVGLTMQNLDAPLADDGTERAGVFLTNALTGWEPRVTKPLPFPELEEERDRAEKVKQETLILVILGNPPYNGFAGVAVDEERELSEAYRTTEQVRPPEGQGLNDLYVRFFRMAERRIAEKTGQGVVCFISNYSWLDGLSFTGMRERYLEAFDAIRIDCLNGDKYKTGKVAPDGSPDPSIFSTEGDPVGIQVGTAISTLVRKGDHEPAKSVAFRHLWGQAKPAELIATAEAEPDVLYSEIEPVLPLGLPFVQTAVSADWFDWPALPDLFPVSFPGVQTCRDQFLVDTDLDRLQARVGDYFDAALSHEEIARRYPRVMKSTARFDAPAVRDALLRRGGPDESGFIRFAYRPFDNRWLYWESDTKLLDEKRADYRPHVFDGNMWLSAAQHLRKGAEQPQTWFTRHIGTRHLIERGALMFPAWLRDEGHGDGTGAGRHANLSGKAQRYLDRLELGVEDLFYHVISVVHDPSYRATNAGALRMGWPRIPLPGWPDGEAEGAAEALARSATHGRELATLLDPETPVPGVTRTPLRPAATAIAVPCTVGGRNMAGDDFAVTAGWGHYGSGDAVMPGRGRAEERAYTPEETTAMLDALPVLGDKTFDVYLNGEAFWRNIPAAVWDYRLGGYQILKKWLSYREREVLGRRLRTEEVQHFTDTARRIGAILVALG